MRHPWEKSKFRGRLHLGPRELSLLASMNSDQLRQHARDMLRERIGKLRIDDGRQTPWRGHPVFVAQHATATCCRNCLRMWHKVHARAPLDDAMIERLVELVLTWIASHAHGKRDCACKTCRVQVSPPMRTIDTFFAPSASKHT